MYYYHYDALGSVTEITDSAGNLVERYRYDVYGTPSIFDAQGNPLAESAIGNRYLFTGREYDAESGLYHYRARAYSAVLGRFLQLDPIGHRGGVNLYAYVGNDPVRWIDLFGLSEQDVNKMEKIFEQTLEQMEKEGVRQPGKGVKNAWINSAKWIVPFNKQFGCYKQSQKVQEELRKHQKDFDDEWEFDIDNTQTHAWVEATSSNPQDPQITLDPLFGLFEVHHNTSSNSQKSDSQPNNPNPSDPKKP